MKEEIKKGGCWWVDGGMKGAVNQHRGVRGQKEEAGLYKPENTIKERGRHTSDPYLLLSTSHLHLSILRQMERKTEKKERRERRKGSN